MSNYQSSDSSKSLFGYMTFGKRRSSNENSNTLQLMRNISIKNQSRGNSINSELQYSDMLGQGTIESCDTTQKVNNIKTKSEWSKTSKRLHKSKSQNYSNLNESKEKVNNQFLTQLKVLLVNDEPYVLTILENQFKNVLGFP